MRIIAISIIKNEKNKFLKEWLENNKKFVDLHIFLDNGSTDGTVEFIKNFSTRNKYNVVIEEDLTSFDKNEHLLRYNLWELTRKYAVEGDWILIIDADEIIDAKEINYLSKNCLVNNKFNADCFSFNLLDMWNDKEYRSDKLWSPSKFLCLFTYKDLPYSKKKNKKGLHLGRMPEFIDRRKVINTYINVKHLSYSSEEYRNKKFNNYKENFKNFKKSKKINMQHALSICDKNIELKKIYKDNDSKVVINSLIHNREWFLDYFFQSILNIDYDKEKIFIYLIANNCNDKTIKKLEEFENICKKEGIKIQIKYFNFPINSKEHSWNSLLLERMSEMRTMALDFCKKIKYDFVLSIDSDILVPPFILKQLLSRKCDVISPVFYSRWKFKIWDSYPQVWDFKLPSKTDNFYRTFTKTREVGFLGAFTLINIHNIKKEINYFGWKNAQLEGEDRNFCTKLSINNIKMFADSSFDVIHIDNIKDFNYYLKKGVLKIDNDKIYFWGWDLKRQYRFYKCNQKWFKLVMMMLVKLRIIYLYFIHNVIKRLMKGK